MKKSTHIAGCILTGCAVLASCSSSEGNAPDPEHPRLNAIVLNSSDFKDKYGTEYVWLWSDGTITAMPGLDEVPSPIVNGMFYTNADAPIGQNSWGSRKELKSLYKTTPGGSFTLIADSLYDCGYYSCGLIPVKRSEDSPVEFLDKNGKAKYYIYCGYIDPYFYKGFARYDCRYEGDHGFGVIDNKGNIVVLPDENDYAQGYQVTDSLLLVGSKVLDREGNLLIPDLTAYGIQLNYAYRIIDGNLAVTSYPENEYGRTDLDRPIISYYSLFPEVKYLRSDTISKYDYLATGEYKTNPTEGPEFGGDFEYNGKDFNYVMRDELAKYLSHFTDKKVLSELENAKFKHFYHPIMDATRRRGLWQSSNPEEAEYRPTPTAERVARELRDARGY